jgi:hypothetical protein
VLIALFCCSGTVIARWIINNDRLDLADEAKMARELGAMQMSGKHLVIVEGNHSLQREEFYLFYGDLKFSIRNLTVAQLHENPPLRPLLGVSHARDLPRVKENFPDLLIRSAAGQLVCWEVDGPN